MTLEQEIFEAIGIARDLLYPDWVIGRLSNAKSTAEIDRIMVDARHNM